MSVEKPFKRFLQTADLGTALKRGVSNTQTRRIRSRHGCLYTGQIRVRARGRGLFIKGERGRPFDLPPPCLRASPSSFFGKSVSGIVLGYDLVQFEDWQEHRDHD